MSKKKQPPLKFGMMKFRMCRYSCFDCIVKYIARFFAKDKKGTMIEKIETFTWTEGLIFKRSYLGLFFIYRRNSEKKK